ncbi:MAG: hypothetical protein HWD61_13985 [Parachlamydiaceae bacterium]|nr:MAG: hypothetical protein HWD61_13985 [Parachlamydiaceae bacterium]
MGSEDLLDAQRKLAEELNSSLTFLKDVLKQVFGWEEKILEQEEQINGRLYDREFSIEGEEIENFLFN